MKTRAFLITLLIAAQAVWLGWQHYAADAELAAAPRIVVSADPPYRSVVKPTTNELLAHPQLNGNVGYSMDSTSLSIYCNFPGHNKLNFTLELALRENRPPIATQAFINGVPLQAAISAMKNGKIPTQAH